MREIKENSIVLDFNTRFAKVMRVYRNSRMAHIKYYDGEETNIDLSSLREAAEESIANLNELIEKGFVNQL